MGRARVEDKNIRKLTKLSGGYSYGVTLPIDIIRQFGWKEKQKLQLQIDEKKKIITIKDWEKKLK